VPGRPDRESGRPERERIGRGVPPDREAADASKEEIRKEIVAFLAGEFAQTGHRTCSKLDLAPAGTRGMPMRAWDRNLRPELFQGQAQVEALAGEILTVAEDYAGSHKNEHRRFVLQTYQLLGQRARLAFWLGGEEDGDDASRDSPAAANARPDVEAIRVRVVVSATDSKVEVYYEDVNELGERYWDRWTDGLQLHRIPGVTIWRRTIVAEAFRRLAGLSDERLGYPRSLTQVEHLSTGARILRILP
jgi:hypothetical protein